MRRLRFKVESWAFALLLALARLIPRRMLLALGAFGGMLGYRFDRRHREIAMENLALAYGDTIDQAQADRITRECFKHFGRITMDALYFPKLDADAVGRAVHYEGLEHIRAAYDKGKGVLLFSAHFGHWELIALMQGYLGMPLALVARPLDNPDLERRLAALRGGSGNRILHKRNAVREMVKALRSAIGVAIVIDQDARGEGVFVPYFGHLASTTPTLALLALRTGAAVVPTYSVPQADGSYRVIYEPEVQIVATGDRDSDILRITAKCTAIIERWVREYPHLWLWLHRRWKTRPPSEAAPPAKEGPSNRF